MKKTTSIICDPCYIIANEDWDAWLDKGMPRGEVRYRGNPKQMVYIDMVSDTTTGDGKITYKDCDICVDAGLLCVAHSEETNFAGVNGYIGDDAYKKFPEVLAKFANETSFDR